MCTKDVFTPEFGQFDVFLIFFSYEVNARCLTKDKINDPIYLLIGQVEIPYVFVDDGGQGESLKCLEVGV